MKKNFLTKDLSTDSLKLIAIITMFIDHVPFLFPGANTFEGYYKYPFFIFHLIGRICAPIIFFMIVEGFYRTRSVHKYMLRLLIFTAISYVPYILFFEGPIAENFLDLNIMWTLFLCVALLQSLHTGKGLFKWIRIIVVSILIMMTGYNFLALALILIFDTFRNDKPKIACAYFVVIAVYTYMNLPGSIIAPSSMIIFTSAIRQYLNYLLVLIVGYILPPLFILRYKDPYIPPEKRRKRNFLQRYFFYIFYPLHICILICIKSLMEHHFS
ncbi:MAG: conjugal transfer protein TraX [Ruminococcus sp.]|jgi:hypothetical protein|nr:conjugal transfer protein TraX [Ruminococcus sp.]